MRTPSVKSQILDPDDAKAMKERSDKMTSEMKTFKNRMYHSFIYINLLWIVICSIVQIFGHKLKIYIFSEAFVSSLNAIFEYTIYVKILYLALFQF